MEMISCCTAKPFYTPESSGYEAIASYDRLSSESKYHL